MKIRIFILVLFFTMNAQAKDRLPYVKIIHDESFDARSKVDPGVSFVSSKMITYLDRKRKRNIEVALIVFPDCFYIEKYRSDEENSDNQYCGAKLVGVKNKRYKNSGVDENGYWDMRYIDNNPDHENAYRYNFHLELDGDVTFNLARGLNSNTFIFSCEQKFNSNNNGVAPNPPPICTLEAKGRKGDELKELYDEFSPKKYWNKLDTVSE